MFPFVSQSKGGVTSGRLNRIHGAYILVYVLIHAFMLPVISQAPPIWRRRIPGPNAAEHPRPLRWRMPKTALFLSFPLQPSCMVVLRCESWRWLGRRHERALGCCRGPAPRGLSLGLLPCQGKRHQRGGYIHIVVCKYPLPAIARYFGRGCTCTLLRQREREWHTRPANSASGSRRPVRGEWTGVLHRR